MDIFDLFEDVEPGERERRGERRRKNFRPRVNMRQLSLEYFRERFRMVPTVAEAILAVLGPFLQHHTMRNHALQPHEQLLLALRFFATGSFYHAVGDMHGPSKATVCRVVRRVAGLLVTQLGHAIKWPATEEDNVAESRGFYAMAGVPNVIGCIDGTHVRLRVPGDQEDLYINRHHQTSINVVAVAGHRRQFTFVSVHAPGRMHDSRVMQTSGLPQLVHDTEAARGRGVVLGDSAYPSLSWLVTPYDRPDTPAQERFNKKHASTRVTIEHAFGMLKMRWAAVDGKELRQQRVADCARTIMACFILHNVCTSSGDDGRWLMTLEPTRAARLVAEEVERPAEPAEDRGNQPLPARPAANQEAAAERRRGMAVRDSIAQLTGGD